MQENLNDARQVFSPSLEGLCARALQRAETISHGRKGVPRRRRIEKNLASLDSDSRTCNGLAGSDVPKYRKQREASEQKADSGRFFDSWKSGDVAFQAWNANYQELLLTSPKKADDEFLQCCGFVGIKATSPFFTVLIVTVEGAAKVLQT